ncbi:DUF1254 domain-containing protein [Noviherbaspirillum saxi]|uniref:DUF1254 domain-containing protein n=1 Tax=Noviherbaspirillum saxi TaxID=2320863 RepID=A0A3A3GCD4_9BURK|nr:DUF1254 domain-containing protein [Noviherbaspirillum saxi]RJF98549.1 DUF1254 domain-containing protein [Noviherbaspirillum saxi]
MFKRRLQITAAIALTAPALLHAQSSASTTVPVTVDNFKRAESDMFFGGVVERGGFGKFQHRRELVPVDKQGVVRPNRDTLYSSAVFDLDAGPVTITLPDPGKRFISMIVIDEDHYVPVVVYAPGTYTFTKEKVGTRYVLMGVRTLVDPTDPNDFKPVHALQDAIKVQQTNTGRFDVPDWDRLSQKKIRDALLVLGTTVSDSRGMFGTKDQVNPVQHLIGTARSWGGNPEKDASMLYFTPSKNDGVTIYKVNIKDVPVDGFWSITVYNADGYLQPNTYGAYSLNNITAKKSKDGSVAVQFGGCDSKIANCLPITPGWNYTMRLYRPRAEILNGSWTRPEPQPAH